MCWASCYNCVARASRRQQATRSLLAARRLQATQPLRGKGSQRLEPSSTSHSRNMRLMAEIRTTLTQLEHDTGTHGTEALGHTNSTCPAPSLAQETVGSRE